jgi:hypothetical protein
MEQHDPSRRGPDGPASFDQHRGDSSFALMLSAQERGHELYYYDVKSLAWKAGRVTAEGAPVTVQRVAGDHYKLGEVRKLDLGSDADVVLMRQDPPFDLGYITATHLLEAGGRDAGRQRSAFGAQCAGKSLCARLRALHAAHADHPFGKGRARLPARTG